LKDNKAPTCPKIVLLDTTEHFLSLTKNPHDVGRPDLHSVTVGAGVSAGQLLEFLELNGLGLYSAPAVSAPTVGGMLAVGAHGTGVGSAIFDRRSPGHSPGTFSNLVMNMTIVAWQNSTGSFGLKTITRSDTIAKAFLTNFGRTIITLVTIRVGKNQNLRSQNRFFVGSRELFAHPNEVTDSTRTLSKFVETYGRVMTATAPPGNLFWVSTWHNEPLKPPKSRKSLWPYNYIFMAYNPLPNIVDSFLYSLYSNAPGISKLVSLLAPSFLMLTTKATRSDDYWGPSKNHFLYSTSEVPHMSANSFLLITSRRKLQLVLHIMRRDFTELLREYVKNQNYPTPGLLDMRITGLDNPDFIEVLGAESPSLSPLSPVPEFPDFDTGVWMDTTGYQDTPYVYEFLVRFQSLLYQHLHGKHAVIRAEWSKSWAYDESGSWRNFTVLNHFPRTFSSSDQLEEWNWAVRTLDDHDPHRVFSNSFLDEFLSVK